MLKSEWPCRGYKRDSSPSGRNCRGYKPLFSSSGRHCRGYKAVFSSSGRLCRGYNLLFSSSGRLRRGYKTFPTPTTALCRGCAAARPQSSAGGGRESSLWFDFFISHTLLISLFVQSGSQNRPLIHPPQMGFPNGPARSFHPQNEVSGRCCEVVSPSNRGFRTVLRGHLTPQMRSPDGPAEGASLC